MIFISLKDEIQSRFIAQKRSFEDGEELERTPSAEDHHVI